MQVEWERFKTYDDGSQSNRSYGTFTFRGKEYEVTIIDHTRPGQKEDDQKYRRDVTHAYEISGLPYYIGHNCFIELGFEEYPALDSVGIDRNPVQPEADDYEYCYAGLVPEHTIEEVEHLVEDAFVRAFCFDYKTEYNNFMKELNERQSKMNEVLSWKESRDKDLEEEMER